MSYNCKSTCTSNKNAKSAIKRILNSMVLSWYNEISSSPSEIFKRLELLLVLNQLNSVLAIPLRLFTISWVKSLMVWMRLGKTVWESVVCMIVWICSTSWSENCKQAFFLGIREQSIWMKTHECYIHEWILSGRLRSLLIFLEWVYTNDMARRRVETGLHLAIEIFNIGYRITVVK